MIVRVSAVAFFLVLLPPAFPTCHDHQRGAGVTWKQISAARAIPRSFARIHLPRACRLRGGEGEGVPSAPTDFVAVAKEMHEERARDFEEVDAAMRRIASAVPNMHKGLKKIHGLGRLADRLGRVDPTEAIQALGREGSMLSGMSDEVKEMEELGKEAARVAERVKEDAEKEMREAVEEVGGRDGFEIPEGGEGDPTMAVIAEHQKMLEELKEGYSSMERMLGGVAQAAAPPATPIKVHRDQVALWRACDEGNAEKILRIASKPTVDINMADPNHWAGLTACHFASRSGSAQAVAAVIESGGDAGRMDILLETPLHCASREGHAGIVRVLLIAERSLPRGGGLEAENHIRQTPLMLACEGNDCIEPRDDEEVGVQPGNKHGVLGTVEALLEAGADPNAFDEAGWTAMHYAARAGRGRVVEMLIKAGGDVNAKNARGHTPLDWAIEGELCGGGGKGKDRTVAILEEAGGVVSITRKGDSVWDTYCHDGGDVGGVNHFKEFLEGEVLEAKGCIDVPGDEDEFPTAEERVGAGRGGGNHHRPGSSYRMEDAA